MGGLGYQLRAWEARRPASGVAASICLALRLVCAFLALYFADEVLELGYRGLQRVLQGFIYLGSSAVQHISAWCVLFMDPSWIGMSIR
jgi:hypothetical protein